MNFVLLSKLKYILLFLCFCLSSLYPQTVDPTILLLSPNGEEYWTDGSFPRITWKSSNIIAVKVDISTDGGALWQTLTPATIASKGSYSSWQINNIQSNQCLVKVSKYDDPSVYDVSDIFFKIVNDSAVINLVVLGSSTAAGVGASTIDSAWVTRYKNYLFEKNTTIKVINLAVGGYTTYDIMPTGFVPPPNRPTPKIANNITKAINYNPKAIIINLPSNDVTNGYTIIEQISNYDSIAATAKQYNIPMWVSTTQPRNLTTAQIQQQMIMRDSTYSRFSDKAIDFWTDIADSIGKIKQELDSGDGIHLNDKGHAILFSKVVNANVFDPTVTSVQNVSESIFDGYQLAQNYPNPFNPQTTIGYQVPNSGFVTLKVYNILGEEVSTLVNEIKSAGYYKLNFSGNNLASGIYIYTIKYDNHILSKKMVVLK